MKHPPLLFLDCETVGLPEQAPIWEIAGIRVSMSGLETGFQTFVNHDPGQWLLTLPKSFVDDYKKRYDPELAHSPTRIIEKLCNLADGGAIVAGSNPGFDVTRIERMGRELELDLPPWHYHSLDIPTLVHGYLLGKGIAPAPPWKSDLLSQMVGVDPTEFDRHTAMGDAQWCLAMWRAVT